MDRYHERHPPKVDADGDAAVAGPEVPRSPRSAAEEYRRKHPRTVALTDDELRRRSERAMQIVEEM
jgi:hypothetical protein